MKTITIKNITIGSDKPKICCSLSATTLSDLLVEVTALLQQPIDIIEWRMDFFEDILDIKKAIYALEELTALCINTPLLCTFRTKQEGGNKEITIPQYVQLYQAIIESKACDLIDLEIFLDAIEIPKLITLAHTNAIKVIASNHDFFKTPTKEEIIRRLCVMQEAKADIAKIAVMPTCKKDVLTVLDATLTMHEEHANIPLVTMAMGDIGMVSRLCGELCGSSITFGSAKTASAPGQIPIASLASILETLHF